LPRQSGELSEANRYILVGLVVKTIPGGTNIGGSLEPDPVRETILFLEGAAFRLALDKSSPNFYTGRRIDH
jgi:hypothetical protein